MSFRRCVWRKKAYSFIVILVLLGILLTGYGQSAQTSSVVPTPAITDAPESAQAEPTTPPEETAEPNAPEPVPSKSTTEDTVTELVSSSTVCVITDISPAGLMAVYNVLGREPTGKVAVRLSASEPPAK